MNYVEIAFPFFILATGLELLYGAIAGRQTYRLNDTVNSLALEQARMASLLGAKRKT